MRLVSVSLLVTYRYQLRRWFKKANKISLLSFRFQMFYTPFYRKFYKYVIRLMAEAMEWRTFAHGLSTHTHTF